MRHIGYVLPWAISACLVGCGDTALLNVSEGSGPSPQPTRQALIAQGKT